MASIFLFFFPSSAFAVDEVILPGLLDLAVPEGSTLQDECDFWMAPDADESDLDEWITVCIEHPMESSRSIGPNLEEVIERDWVVFNSMGYSVVYQARDDTRCPSQFAVSLMTKEALDDPWERSAAETAVWLFMVDQNYETYCE